MSRCAYLKDVVTLKLDGDACTGCGMCIEVCPHAVFVLDDGKARIAYRDACMECGACARNCPSGALAVQAGVGCANAVINAALKRDSACCRIEDVGGGSCCSSESSQNQKPRCGCC